MILRQIHYGWVMVFLGMLVETVHTIMNYTFGIFLVPITSEFGWERGALSIALSLALFVGGGLGMVTGRLCDRYGPRPLVTIGGMAAGTAYLLMSQISSLWQVYLIWGILLGIAWSCCTVTITSTIPRWFSQKKGLAQGLTMTGVGVGGIIWPPITQALITSYGWQRAYITLGIITLVIIVSLAQFLRHSPQRMGLKPYGEKDNVTGRYTASDLRGLSFKQVARSSHFWFFGLLLFSFMFCTRLIITHIVPHTIDIGILAIISASIVSITAAFNLIGRIAIGFISDRVGHRPALTTSLGLMTLAMIWLSFANQVWMFYIFAMFFGLAMGGVVPMFALVSAELFGLKYLGIIVGTTTFMGTIGGAIGTPLGGTIFDLTGSYVLAFRICSILGAIAIILSVIILRSKRYSDI